MNVGIRVCHSKKDIHEEFQNLVDFGFHHCQLISWDSSLWTEQEVENIKDACEKYGVTITAFWCGWQGPNIWDFYDGPETLGLVPVAYRYSRMQDLMNGADFAKKIGVTDVITHVGFIPENPHDSNYQSLITCLKVIAGHYQRNNQNFLFETGQETPVTLLRAFEDIGYPNLGINLDPANLIMYGKANPVDALDVFGKYVKGMHAKDAIYPTDGKNLGLEVPIGQGKVDFNRLLRRLKECGYDGSITIEREIEGEQQIDDIKNGKKILQTIIDEMSR